MTREVKRAIRAVVWAVKLRDSYWARTLWNADVPLMAARCDSKGNLFLGDPGLLISRDLRPELLLRHLGKAQAMLGAGGSVRYGNASAVLSFQGVEFEITTDQTLSIVHEVFFERTYGIRSHYQDSVVIDIGMNIGVSSLFFAMQGYRVYGFEPFAETYGLAERNFALNPELATRIIRRQIGLGQAAAAIQAQYCPESPGDCGVTPIPEQYRRGRHVREETIRLEAAADVLFDIARIHENQKLIVKMDCEGSEIAIMRSLREAGVVRLVRAFLIEWHRRASEELPASLEELLVDEGFFVFSRGWPGTEVGMIYAVRT